MLYEWIRDHKKLALLIGAGSLILLLVIIALLTHFFEGDNPAHEEPEMKATVIVSNVDILYNSFSDYTIGYILNAINAALAKDMSMKNGSPANEDKIPAVDSINEELYPAVDKGGYLLTIKNNTVSDFSDDWGIWKTFTIVVNDGRSFKVDVALGAHNRNNDVGYTKISVTKI